MGALRGIALVFVVVLLFVSFLLMGTFATLNLSLEHDVVKLQLNPFIKTFIEEKVDLTVIEQQENILKNSCNTRSEYVFSDEATNKTFVIPCEVIANGSDAIIDYEINFLIDENYYQEYDCEFWKCFREAGNPFFLVSQHAQNYWESKFYTFLFISILLSVLIFLLVEKKVNFPILAGILLSVSFIPVAWLDSIGKAILRLVLSSMKGAVDGLASIDLNSFVLIFFSEANNVFLTGFVIGLILVGVGIFLKLLKVGFKINHFLGIRFGSKKSKEKGSERVQVSSASKEGSEQKKEVTKPKVDVSKDKKGEVGMI